MIEGFASSWALRPAQAHQLQPLFDRFTAPEFEAGQSYLAYGNGRSYGDSCLNTGHGLFLTRALDRFIEFNKTEGVIRCEAGVTLDEVLRLVEPHGWFLPVTPGTRFVTVGGAVANDVHGKNHHTAGTFGCHVVAFELVRSDGRVIHCSANQETELFAATIGGLGLTGLIRWVEFRLKKIAGPWIDGETIKFGSLEEFDGLSTESDRSFEYTVAWIDCLSKHGRGVFSRGNHAAHVDSEPRERVITVPVTSPVSLVNSMSVRVMNSVLFGKQLRKTVRHRWHYRPFFYPLDGVLCWNRLYGPRGFFQFQCALPSPSAVDAIREMLRVIRAEKQGSFLAVLKKFGARVSPGMLSFPRPGMTLAVDFPNRGPQTLRLLAQLESITIQASGALYPAKDAIMSPRGFRASFGMVDRFISSIDPQFSSTFWRRVTA
jgi:FAD/FMN-containing dehydrogenase